MASGRREEQLVLPGRLTGMKFDMMTREEMEKFSVLKVEVKSDLTSPKMGIPNTSPHTGGWSSTSPSCATCGGFTIETCHGHSGYIELPEDVFNPYFVPEIVEILNKICPWCNSIRHEHESQLKDSLSLEAIVDVADRVYDIKSFCINLDDWRREVMLLRKLFKTNFSPCNDEISDFPEKFTKDFFEASLKDFRKVLSATNKQTGCKYCLGRGESSGWHPMVRFKASSRDMSWKKLVIVIAEVGEMPPRKYRTKNVSDVLPVDYWDFIPNDPRQPKTTPSSAKVILTPYQVSCMLEKIDPNFIKKFVQRPEFLFLSSLPVAPNCFRVTERHNMTTSGPSLYYDDRNASFDSLLAHKRKCEDTPFYDLRQTILNHFNTTSHALKCFNLTKLRASSSTDSGASKCGARYLRELVFGKLTDSSFRMVVVGDPKVRLNEIGISEDIAESLEIFELVSTWNLAKLKKTRLSFHPRRHKSDRGKHVHQHPKNKLEIGTEIRRPLENGDVIMINRPPSVHQHSIIALSVRILPPNSVISINPLCCAPLFGDFDGDCLHGYIPQSLTSRIELKELVHMNNQLLNSQDGRSLLSLSQDSLTAAHLLTGGDVFLNKVQMQQLEMLCARQSQHPTIFSSSTQTPLWTGNQLFSMCLPKNLDLKISDSVEIRKGELLFAPNGSSWLQNTSSGIFSALFKHCQSEALDFLFSAQDVLCEWLSMRGLSVTLCDMNLSPDSNTRTKMMEEVRYGLQEALEKCHVRQLMTETTIMDSLEAEDIDDGPYPSSTLTSINRDSLGAFRDVFHDIQNVVQSYASKENSMLAMVHSGSVGSMTKLVQQGVCLGVHHPAIPLPFKFPHRLSCDSWVQQKASSTDGTPKDVQERVNVPCAVMENSFLSGLNPLECFFHALVSRNNLFSENAAIPGTLNRKLMYYMCDISVAYDGTVRNAYGNQIIQFSYGIPEVTSGDYVSQSDKFIGQPVGALAASAISEAAYGALEFPVTKLQASPLMNLKSVLNSGQVKTSAVETISLYLSKKLRRLNYGFEYGALEVQGHLERVFFSDIISTVEIFSCKQSTREMQFSPWITHFHVCEERMLKRRLTLESIIDAITKKYDSVREGTKIDLPPRLYISSRECSELEKDGSFCIRVMTEISKTSTSLETIRDVIIPELLKTVMKGFIEFKKVDILWDELPSTRLFRKNSSGELSLKVIMSESCTQKNFWSTLQSACIPIMDLIDWGRSHPDNTSDVFSSFGIDATWRYFIGGLKSATSDAGRSIHPRHLLITADCMSVTGEFLGLNAKAIKQQRKQASVSSPFMQSCFSTPGTCLIKAAKDGARDDLVGAIDAAAWGKKTPVGTGGSFEILYTGKGIDIEKPENIYETLCSQAQILGGTEAKKQPSSRKNIRRRAKSIPVHRGSKVRRHAPLTSKLNRVPRSFGSWKSMEDMHTSLQRILFKYPIGSSLDKMDASIIFEALLYHPNKDAKLALEPQEIKVDYNKDHPDTRCFFLVGKDGTIEDFSYHKCIRGAAQLFAQEKPLKKKSKGKR